MKKFLLLFPFSVSIFAMSSAQSVNAPDKIYGRLFIDVQMSRIFPDNKTFADCVPKRGPQKIMADYLSATKNPSVKFSLKQFVEENFITPQNPANSFHTDTGEDVKAHIIRLWDVLKREADTPVNGNSRLALPNAYIVPGGRFREIYYWDSYFTMLGLQESNRYDMIENMVKNFAYLISQYGHIPNGNRTYYLSRSQPPYFSLMLELLAEKQGSKVYALYKDALQKEYDYWMDKTAATKHVVQMPDGEILNRYYDQSVRPRQESFYEDSALAINYNGDKKSLYRNLRSCAESGWDFSTRWFADSQNLSSIQVTDLVPVDLNCLLYHLELTLAKAYKETGNLLQQNYYNQLAEKRKRAINKYCFNKDDNWYYDYNILLKGLSKEKTIAGTTPLFLNVAPQDVAKDLAEVVLKDFLKAGGLITTLKNSGQQWDAPNGWAPLQFIAIKGLDNYGLKDAAKEIATHWVQLNIKVYKSTGKLMEKYNVEDTHLEAGGGEYPSQDGFGWTNGVLMKLMAMYNLPEQ
jgi:alpha,alpha-trehalase